MRILHFYPKTDAAICQYFDMLASNMGLEVENHKASTSEEARQLLRNIDFDILHVHGCWNNAQFMIVRKALQQGARLVVTPYGQLQPWVQQQHFWKEKLPKRIAYQKSIVEQAYAVIVQGNMELECIAQLAWNKRCSSSDTTSSKGTAASGQSTTSWSRSMTSTSWPARLPTTTSSSP